MAFNIFRRKPKPKPEIKRLEVSAYGEPKYEFTHIPTLEVYREYNDTVSAPAIARDKQLKRAFGLIMGVIAIVFAVLGAVWTNEWLKNLPEKSTEEEPEDDGQRA